MLPHASVSLCWSEPIKERELSYQSQSGLGISITSQPCLETGYSEARDTQKRVTESELLFAPEPVRTKDQIVEKEFVAYHFIVLEKFQKFLKSHQISCNRQLEFRVQSVIAINVSSFFAVNDWSSGIQENKDDLGLL